MTDGDEAFPQPVILHEWHVMLLVASGVAGDLALQMIENVDAALRRSTDVLSDETRRRYPGCAANIAVER